MAIRKIGEQVAIVRLEISLIDLPSLLSRHASAYPGGRELEAHGQRLIASGFEPRAAAGFIADVCAWGGGARNTGRVLAKNTPAELSTALREGYERADSGHVPEGIERIQRLNFLGLSFASKQLRFLAPTRAVILDSVIRTRIGYPESPDGYRSFLADCQAILALARESGSLEMKLKKELRVCDIEAAIFVQLRNS